jgi:Predicted ATP-utilizing enzyme (ATP-grasp superfamily)
MAPTVLLTLGRLPKALTLARCLKAQGCRVVVAEPFNWHLSKPSNAIDACWITPSPNLNPAIYRDRLRSIVEAESIDVVIPISEESQYVLASSIGDTTQLGALVLGPSAELYSQLQDKWLFVQRAKQRQVSVPYSVLAEHSSATDFDGPTVSKPRRGCSGLGVAIHEQCPNPAGLPEGSLLQQYVSGASCCSLSLLENGVPIATALYRSRVNTGTVAVCFESITTPAAVNDWISAFCAGLDYTGFIAFDFIIDAEGLPWGIECNPRLTSGIHF